jgi:hypothetical protein
MNSDEINSEQDLTTTELGPYFEDLENDLRQLLQSETEFKKHQVELIEMKHVLRIAGSFFERTRLEASTSVSPTDIQPHAKGEQFHQQPSVVREPLNQAAMSYVTGIISHGSLENFHRTIIVALRGNVHFESEPVPEPLRDANSVCSLFSVP